MELRQLRHLLVLAETSSFSRAAERLHLTQSALSRSIQSLESDLGGLLLDRIGKRNELTPLGHATLEYARRIVQEVDDLKGNAHQLQTGRLGALRLGLGSGPGALLTTSLLAYMAEFEPTVRTEVQRGSPDLQLIQLRNRRLDAMVIDVRRIVPGSDLLIEHLAEMRAGFICRRAHPLAGSKRLAFEELLAYPIASTPLSDEVARQLVGLYGPKANPDQMTTLCCEEIASLIETVRHTNAIYLGICAAARADLLAGELVELPVHPSLSARARFALITLAGRTENPAIGFLRGFVAKHLRE
jgi:DNA-binding transcriptional LysR family regulator